MSLSSKERFRDFCNENKNVPLFLTYNWFNALFDKSKWNVVIAEKNEIILGFMPYVIESKKGFNIISTLPLTPYQGVFYNYPENQKYTNKISFEKEVSTQIIASLPKIDSFTQNFIPEFNNWLPFYWKGFKQTTRYTYLLKDITNTDVVFKNFRENIRREIRKAEKQLVVSIHNNIEDLFNLKEQIYKSNNTTYPIPKNILLNAYKHTKANHCGELLKAVDENGNIHSYLFYVWDNTTTYYIHGATNPNFKTSGSMTLLLWQAINNNKHLTKQFNFEGSMVESIERYFRAFGGELTPYYQISKTNSAILKLLNK